MPLRRRGLWSAAALVAALPALPACVSLAPIRDRQHDRVTSRAVQKAAASTDDAVRTGLEDLLAVRLADPARVSFDLAAEAVVSIGKIGQAASLPILVRVLREEPEEEVRFLAIEAVARVDATSARPLWELVAASDSSGLVRDRARELLATLAPGK